MATNAKFLLLDADAASTLRGKGSAANEQGESLARRRFQRGTLLLKEKTDEHGRIDNERSIWIGRWREDEIREGRVFRVRKYQELGSKAVFPSRRLALRELEKRISSINDPSYRARPVSSFELFAERWQKIVLVQHKPSTQSTIRSHVRKYLVPHFGQLQLRDIQPEQIQHFIAGIDASPKTVRNIFVTLQLLSLIHI